MGGGGRDAWIAERKAVAAAGGAGDVSGGTLGVNSP